MSTDLIQEIQIITEVFVIIFTYDYENESVKSVAKGFTNYQPYSPVLPRHQTVRW